MCLAREAPTPQQPGKKWRELPSGGKWRSFLFHGGKKKWRALKEWGQTNFHGMEQTIHMVSMWVLNLNINFALVSLPLLFLAFLSILSPHRDIQYGLCGMVMSMFLLFYLRGPIRVWVDIFGEPSVRWRVYKLLRKTTVSSLEDTEIIERTISLRMEAYKVLPLNHLSRAWGYLADTELPPPLNYISVWLFAKLAKCDRSEAEFSSLSEYKTISHFFRRRLKPGVRPVCSYSSLVSPADGTLTHIGPVEGRYLEQVKGIRYCINQFFGNLEDEEDPQENAGGVEEFNAARKESTEEVTETIEIREKASVDNLFSLLEKSCAVREEKETIQLFHESSDLIPKMEGISKLLKYPGSTALYQAVVYLSPSDYHRFHSPTSWIIQRRRHFPGKLYSVSPAIVRRMPGLFHTNERVSLIGEWKYGFFSLTAVGATNVGSIVINFDEDLNTNIKGQEYSEEKYPGGGLKVGKGEEIGYFNFGSTIVLVFEAPFGYQFRQTSKQRVKVGQAF